MKVGTDGVLLGAWTELPLEPALNKMKPVSAKKYLDIGTGTGVIALMLAQKHYPEQGQDSENIIIDAIDTDESSCIQARENIAASKFNGKINVIHQSLHQFIEKANQNSYDLIVSNPPYFFNSLKSPDTYRNRVRHSDISELGPETLISSALKLLTTDGIFSLILPKNEGGNFIIEAEKSFLYCNRLTHIFPKPGKECIRFLMQFQRSPSQMREDNLTIETGKALNDFTGEYKLLTREFYLNF